MQPLKEAFEILNTLKPSEIDHFLNFVAFENPKQHKNYIRLTDLVIKKGKDDLPNNKALSKIFPSPQVYRRVNEYKDILKKYLLTYIIPEESYAALNSEVIYLRYLRNHGLMDQFESEFEDVKRELEASHSRDDFRSLYINFLNESRRNFYHVYYNEQNFKYNSVAANYKELDKIKKWINSGHLFNKIFYDFSLRAAHKIEEGTLQKSAQKAFTPEFFSFKEYMEMLDSQELPLLYKTYILDILEGNDKIKARTYHQVVEKIFYSNYHEASVNVKNNILILLISSSKIPQELKSEYYKELVDLKEELNPGVLNKYILEHLEKDVKKARTEFDRLRNKAKDPENDLNAIEGIVLCREGKYNEALELLNQVMIYQQDNMYFDVNLALLKAYYEIGDIEVAHSKLNNLKVYYHKYKEHMGGEKESKYKYLINDYKRMLDGK
ncbi:MAG: hypothetical protein RIB47_07075 [Cyclobacteriaceae bacterium]